VQQRVQNLRMLVNELGGIVDDVVDDDEQVLLGVVLSNVLECVFGRHFDKGCVFGAMKRTRTNTRATGSRGGKFKDSRRLDSKQSGVDLEVKRSKKELEMVTSELSRWPGAFQKSDGFLLAASERLSRVSSSLLGPNFQRISRVLICRNWGNQLLIRWEVLRTPSLESELHQLLTPPPTYLAQLWISIVDVLSYPYLLPSTCQQ
jgi:hypothetical protein